LAGVSDDDAAAQVAHDLRLAVGRLARRLRQLYAQHPGDQLSFTELAVLSRLHRDGPATASQLANGDRRKTIVSLTDPGRAAFTVREQTVIDRMVQAVASGCTAAERRQLAAAAPLLERLAGLL
jgi:DNA-binding MarR family transcriptional regulator